MKLSHRSTHRSRNKLTHELTNRSTHKSTYKSTNRISHRLTDKYLEKNKEKEFMYSNAIDLSTISEESPNEDIRKIVFRMFGDYFYLF
jgi:hypothetical protein